LLHLIDGTSIAEPTSLSTLVSSKNYSTQSIKGQTIMTIKCTSIDFPIERLRELYGYDPETGYLTSKRYSGRPVKGSLRCRTWAVHLCHEDGSKIGTNYGRVVFAWHHGRWPVGTIDHINMDPRNKRIVRFNSRTDLASTTEQPGTRKTRRGRQDLISRARLRTSANSKPRRPHKRLTWLPVTRSVVGISSPS
jgi:hypothetical protein